jgi:hypothetical protein
MVGADGGRQLSIAAFYGMQLVEVCVLAGEWSVVLRGKMSHNVSCINSSVQLLRTSLLVSYICTTCWTAAFDCIACTRGMLASFVELVQERLSREQPKGLRNAQLIQNTHNTDHSKIVSSINHTRLSVSSSHSYT